MNTLAQIKKDKENKINELINECSIFFAFSNEQFHQNKTPLKEGEKYVSMGAGGYIPKGNLDKYFDGIKQINKGFKSAVKESKVRKEHIIYELNNHEAFYTGDIEDTLNALGSDYTHDEVMEVYKTERKNQIVLS